MFVKSAVNFLSDIFDYYNILCFPYFWCEFYICIETFTVLAKKY